MTLVVDVVSAVLMIGGSLFAVVAAIGLVRLSDSFLRIHIATKPATLSVAMVGLGAILQLPGLEARTQLALAIVFQFWTAPVASHMLGRAIRQHRGDTGETDDTGDTGDTEQSVDRS